VVYWPSRQLEQLFAAFVRLSQQLFFRIGGIGGKMRQAVIAFPTALRQPAEGRSSRGEIKGNWMKMAMTEKIRRIKELLFFAAIAMGWREFLAINLFALLSSGLLWGYL
ncbi:hypothetical protein U1Q18_003081, partial [Sarracenia purpurea var. burkii]